ncbi:vWA domain-containing protein [Parvibaculum sp.]|uniref:vWA domain-containing protein n=1 Tax=Parvibaculum sp. TaxID=2024848 RepID=UPI002FDB6763
MTMLTGCSYRSEKVRDLFILVDVSGSYFEHSERSFQRIRSLLFDLSSGDKLTVAQVDSCSFGDGSEWISEEVDYNPLQKGADIRGIADELARVQKSLRRSSHTDITGAFLRASRHFARSRSNHKVIIVFSDLKEDTALSCPRDESIVFDLEDITIILADVAISDVDARKPEAYLRNIKHWRDRLLASGARDVIEARGASQISDILASLRADG